ncbi:MAG: hypothetical protein KGK18_13960, partial [Burkholderiales bacterium]|nr:hypothetical protein [Burkholderiales bacterium]
MPIVTGRRHRWRLLVAHAFLWALIATGTLQLWQLYILVLLLGFTNSLGRPASRAIIVEMVGHEAGLLVGEAQVAQEG